MCARVRSNREERWNTITHSAAFGMALTSIFMANNIAGKLLASALATTFFLSTIYHSEVRPKEKNFLCMLDMASIHVTIAVTGATFCTFVNSAWWPLCLVIPCYGFYYTIKNFDTHRLKKNMVPLCVASSVVCLVVLGLSSGLSSALGWFSSGLLVYCAGLVFYVHDGEWYHTVWHIFVTIASFVHIRFLW